MNGAPFFGPLHTARLEDKSGAETLIFCGTLTHAKEQKVTVDSEILKLVTPHYRLHPSAENLHKYNGGQRVVGVASIVIYSAQFRSAKTQSEDGRCE